MIEYPSIGGVRLGSVELIPLIGHGNEKHLLKPTERIAPLKHGDGCATYAHCGSCGFPDCLWDERLFK